MISIGGMERGLGVTGNNEGKLQGGAPDIVWAGPPVCGCLIGGHTGQKCEFHIVIREEVKEWLNFVFRQVKVLVVS